MKLQYIGSDKSLGLRSGEVYECNIVTIPPHVWVAAQMPGGGYVTCPYSSLRALQDNWQEV